MNVKTFLRTGSAAAIAAVLAIGAIPSAAQAQDQGRGHWRESRGGDQTESHRSNGGQQRQQQARAAQAPQQAPQQRTYQAPQQQQRTYQAPAAQQQRQWSRGSAGTAQAGRTWTRGDRGQAQAQAQVQARTQSAERTRSSGWDGNRSGTYNRTGTYNRSGDNTWQRNRTYSDNTRNQTYRSDQYRQQQQRTQNAYRDGNHTSWNRDWRSNNRYNWYSYRNSNRNIYRLGRYYSPYNNYSYSRVGIGFRLGSLFFGSRYWINDPWQYRLPEAYGPYRWIRYYDDALLVDTYTGEVVDVIYDFFW